MSSRISIVETSILYQSGKLTAAGKKLSLSEQFCLDL